MVVPYDPTSPDPTVLAYDYLKYHRGFVAPEDMFPPDEKQRFLDGINKMEAIYGGKTMSGALQSMLKDGYIDAYAKGKYEELIQRLSVPTDLVQTKNWIQGEINYARITTTESCMGRYMVLSVFQTYYQILRYFEEEAIGGGFITGSGSALMLRSSDCTFWDQLGCAVFNWDTLKYALYGALIGCAVESVLAYGFPAGILEMADISFNANNLQIILRCGVALGNPVKLIGIGIGAVAGALTAIILKWGDCACPDCEPVTSLTYRFDDCDPEAQFRPWGYGEDIVEFDWINGFGLPSLATTLASSPELRIADISDQSNMLNVRIDPVCNDEAYSPEPYNKSFDLQNQVLRPRTIVLSGGPVVDWSNGTINYTYVVVGLHWLNLSRYSWTYSVQNGTIISSTDNTVTVNFDEEEDVGEICIYYWVNCPGGQAYTKNYCIEVVLDENIL